MSEEKSALSVVHDTILLEHIYAFPVSDVAWKDPAARIVWGPPSDSEALEYESTDYRVGGSDVLRCGSKGNLNFHVETVYLDIVHEARVVNTETVSNEGGILSAALLTTEFEAVEPGTRLRLAIQIASFVGEGMVTGNREGNQIAMANLDRYLQRRKPSP